MIPAFFDAKGTVPNGSFKTCLCPPFRECETKTRSGIPVMRSIT